MNDRKTGKVIGVGVGPGDPELLTIKATNVIKSTPVIITPGKTIEDSTAYRIAALAVQEISAKKLIAMDLPMVRDKEAVDEAAGKNAAVIESYLDEGLDVAFLTLGDPSIYSTFTYVKRFLEKDGYITEMVSGVPSFCAGAASLNIPLAEWDEQLHIIPSVHDADANINEAGNYVFMKSGKNMGRVSKAAVQKGKMVFAVENCGMNSEKIYKDADEIPDSAGYFSIVFAKDI